MPSFTQKRKQMFEFIADRCRRGQPPSRREVAEKFNMNANAAHQNIKVLVALGYLIHEPAVSRGLQVAKQHRLGIPIVSLEDLDK